MAPAESRRMTNQRRQLKRQHIAGAGAGNRSDFIFFATVAVIFGLNGAFCAATSLVALVMGLIGAEASTDITSYGLSLLTAIPAAIGLGIGAVAWAIARRFRE